MGHSEVGFAGDQPVGGELLAERLAQGPLPPEQALRYAIEIGAALNRAHLRGLVHGGLSPFSVRNASTGARILPPLGEYDQRVAPYRSPEQVRGEAPGWPSDVFAYGALLYEMASGRRAFPGEGAELNDAILEQPVAGLMAKSPIHAAMEGVIAGCLEKDPSRRRRVQNAVIELKPAGRSWQRMAEVPKPRPSTCTSGPRLRSSGLRCRHPNTLAIRARPRSRRMDAFSPSRLWGPKLSACSGCGRWMCCTPT